MCRPGCGGGLVAGDNLATPDSVALHGLWWLCGLQPQWRSPDRDGPCSIRPEADSVALGSGGRSVSSVLFFLAGKRSQDATASDPINRTGEWHLQVEFTKLS